MIHFIDQGYCLKFDLYGSLHDFLKSLCSTKTLKFLCVCVCLKVVLYLLPLFHLLNIK